MINTRTQIFFLFDLLKADKHFKILQNSTQLHCPAGQSEQNFVHYAPPRGPHMQHNNITYQHHGIEFPLSK